MHKGEIVYLERFWIHESPPRAIPKEEIAKAKEIERKKWLESIKKMNAKKGRK